jgi:hypothetical protein
VNGLDGGSMSPAVAATDRSMIYAVDDGDA